MYVIKFMNLMVALLVVCACFPKSKSEALSRQWFDLKTKWEQHRQTQAILKRLERDLAYAFSNHSLFGFLVVCLVGMSVGVWLGLTFNNFFVGLLGIAAGIYLPFRGLRELVARKQKLINRQLEPALTQIANLYKITQNIEQAFKEVTKVLVSPLRDEFIRFEADLERAGMPLEEALFRLGQRLDNKDFHFFANLAVITQKYGGDTKELLHLVPQTLRERQLGRMALDTEVAGAKQQAWFLFLGTPLFLVFFYFARPDFVKILTDTTLGKLGMGLVAFLSLFSLVLIEKITEPVD